MVNLEELDYFDEFEDSEVGQNEMHEEPSNYEADYESNKFTKNTYYKSTGRNVIYDEYYPKRSKKLIDEIDKCIAKYYNFTEEELDFIINYERNYRCYKCTCKHCAH